MNSLTLLKATKKRNGIEVRKTNNDLNSCELRKVSINGRDNGYIGSIAGSTGKIILSGTSWRGKIVNSPIFHNELQRLVDSNFKIIKEIIGGVK